MLIIRLLFDFGILILIWIVQLIIYPGFKHYSPADLRNWHRVYTSRISYVVVPLMAGQLGIASWHLWMAQNLYTFVTFIMILVLWSSTFFIFVPLHSAIKENPSNLKAIKDLVNKNWLRTVLWTVIFIWSFVRFF